MDDHLLDCSSCFPFIDADKVKDIIKHYGAEKVLFGTDYPMWSIKEEIEKIFSIGLDQKELSYILNMNAKKVFGL